MWKLSAGMDFDWQIQYRKSAHIFYERFVEMAGFEPASEGFNLQASTSLVSSWFLWLAVKRQAH